MKLIISELKDRARYTSREAAYIISELIDNYGWSQIETEELYYSSRSLKSLLLNRFTELPEIILCWEGYYLLSARKSEINSLDCAKYIFCDDLHAGEEHSQEEMLEAFSMVNTILSTYGYVFDSFFPELSKTKRVVWIPHSASPDFLLAFNKHPVNAILLSGVVDDYYPLRMRMKALCDKGSYPILTHQHPGYRCDFDHETDTSIGRGYAKRINTYRAAFTDSSKYRYSVAKYFEIPATGALLLADCAVSEPLRRIGFIEGVHYLGVSNEDLEEKIEYTLDENNHDELDEVRRNGQELVWGRHTTSDRARSIDEICTLEDGFRKTGSPFDGESS
ncbi:MAG TPA: glycosyltransferase [Blastocatellia bacterium]|nr:glycosyltransferase [Blastocatellia bacterium]